MFNVQNTKACFASWALCKNYFKLCFPDYSHHKIVTKFSISCTRYTTLFIFNVTLSRTAIFVLDNFIFISLFCYIDLISNHITGISPLFTLGADLHSTVMIRGRCTYRSRHFLMIELPITLLTRQSQRG